ncbi:putative DNA-directed RNA polymerase II subunit N [Acanthamoeba castellanii mimivirus]|uniref:DNA-directed RNA polymerase II subunit N n=5 Tax=Mimivirus TaxID=315393 RepID=E3W040_MIMIV|nr:putative DNA-directed RNA polymerase II subunit N [Acanthamoeba polyphaga mimivirus]AEQ60546.1 hypothetical protein [Acanthamoeba castellanii mamavirus]AHA45506.1 putative DNA-directed RNA polymerase II subunit N [Hirudovirus strain Sangsue]QTF49271.1 putative DNA-directed RNA polymerase II subunit N [Mimivirus reunion]WMV61714.1 putative DNA-directed RNA polymerase II subunit N [Mimivirus sp.]BAV61459.1 putative DNA-directed RNA polymerase II subunit N [Acanthamoeba castellanii mimivirus]
MLFYVRCPTCGDIISFDYDKYMEDLEEVNNNPKLTKRQKDLERSKLLDKYGYNEICHRQRILCQIPYHKIILS